MPILPLKEDIELYPKDLDKHTAMMAQWAWHLARRRRMSSPGVYDPRKIFHASFCPEDEWEDPRPDARRRRRPSS